MVSKRKKSFNKRKRPSNKFGAWPFSSSEADNIKNFFYGIKEFSNIVKSTDEAETGKTLEESINKWNPKERYKKAVKELIKVFDLESRGLTQLRDLRKALGAEDINYFNSFNFNFDNNLSVDELKNKINNLANEKEEIEKKEIKKEEDKTKIIKKIADEKKKYIEKLEKAYPSIKQGIHETGNLPAIRKRMSSVSSSASSVSGSIKKIFSKTSKSPLLKPENIHNKLENLKKQTYPEPKRIGSDYIESLLYWVFDYRHSKKSITGSILKSVGLSSEPLITEVTPKQLEERFKEVLDEAQSYSGKAISRNGNQFSVQDIIDAHTIIALLSVPDNEPILDYTLLTQLEFDELDTAQIHADEYQQDELDTAQIHADEYQQDEHLKEKLISIINQLLDKYRNENKYRTINFLNTILKKYRPVTQTQQTKTVTEPDDRNIIAQLRQQIQQQQADINASSLKIKDPVLKAKIFCISKTSAVLLQNEANPCDFFAKKGIFSSDQQRAILVKALVPFLAFNVGKYMTVSLVDRPFFSPLDFFSQLTSIPQRSGLMKYFDKKDERYQFLEFINKQKVKKSKTYKDKNITEGTTWENINPSLNQPFELDVIFRKMEKYFYKLLYYWTVDPYPSKGVPYGPDDDPKIIEIEINSLENKLFNKMIANVLYDPKYSNSQLCDLYEKIRPAVLQEWVNFVKVEKPCEERCEELEKQIEMTKKSTDKIVKEIGEELESFKKSLTKKDGSGSGRSTIYYLDPSDQSGKMVLDLIKGASRTNGLISKEQKQMLDNALSGSVSRITISEADSIPTSVGPYQMDQGYRTSRGLDRLKNSEETKKIDDLQHTLLKLRSTSPNSSWFSSSSLYGHKKMRTRSINKTRTRNKKQKSNKKRKSKNKKH